MAAWWARPRIGGKLRDETGKRRAYQPLVAATHMGGQPRQATR